MVVFALPAACPPGDSAPASEIFYRLVEPKYVPGDRAERGSWRKPHKLSGPWKGRTEVCEAHALSIYASLDETQTFRDFSPWAASKSVAQVILSEKDGRVLCTPQEMVASHHDWWTDPYDYVPDNVVIDSPRPE